MSAAEKLRALKKTGFTCEHWTDVDASDLDVTDELIAVVEAAEYEASTGSEMCLAALAALDAALRYEEK